MPLLRGAVRPLLTVGLCTLALSCGGGTGAAKPEQRTGGASGTAGTGGAAAGGSGGQPGVGGGGMGAAAAGGAPTGAGGASRGGTSGAAGMLGGGGVAGTGGSAGAAPGSGGVAGQSATTLVGPPFDAARAVVPQAINLNNYSDTTLQDVNGDGTLEVVSLVHVAGDMRSLRVSFQDGRGGFGDPITTPLTPSPQGDGSLLFSDVNGDGNVDALVAHAPDGTVHELLGHGDGSFTDTRTFLIASSTSLEAPLLAAGDMNGDGVIDLVGLSHIQTDGALVVLIGKGDGTFGTRAAYNTGLWLSGVQVTDLTGDKRPEVVVTDGDVMIFPNKGDGRLGEPTVLQSTPAGFAFATTVADLNGDSRPDLIVRTGNGVDGNGLEVRLNRGTSFAAPTPYLGELYAGALAIADLNSDGKPDLLAGTGNQNVAQTEKDGLSVLLNEGGTFGPPALYLPRSVVSTVVVGDLNGDGRTDVAVNPTITPDGQNRDQVQVLFNTGSGKLAAPLELAGNGLATAIVDMDHDGDADIAASNGAVVFTNPGRGMFQPLLRVPSTTRLKSLRLVDLDGDGNLDALTLDAASPAIMLGHGDGTFGPPTAFAEMTAPGSPGLGDLNGDGKVDLVLPFDGPTGSIGVALNTGAGRFERLVTYPTGPYAAASVVGDLNGDGKADIATLVAGAVSVHLNDGHGAFPAHVDYGQTDARLAIVLGDLDGDGRPDLAAAGKLGAYTFHNRGDGTFEPAVKHGTEGLAIALLDVTGDGRPELVVAGNTDALRVYRNDGRGKFDGGTQLVPPKDFVNDDLAALATGDLNGDGRSDLVFLSADYETGYATPFISDGKGALVRGDMLSVGGFGAVLGDVTNDRQVDLMVWGETGIYAFPQRPAAARMK